MDKLIEWWRSLTGYYYEPYWWKGNGSFPPKIKNKCPRCGDLYNSDYREYRRNWKTGNYLVICPSCGKKYTGIVE